MPAVQINDDKSGKEFLDANKDAFVVLFFDGEFSGQEDLVEKGIESLSNANEIKDRIVIGLVDVEKNTELAGQFSVLSVPMVVCAANGKELKKIDTLDPTKLVKSVDEELKRFDLLAGNTGDEQKTDSKQNFNAYLKKLTNRAPVMIFMKGDPQQPRCGFSRQLIDILTKHQITYETFDILQDEEVRQGLKEYSDWPTYPQIYVKGEFIGGLDILKQMEESGELDSTLKIE